MNRTGQPTHPPIGLPPEQFAAAFPFHIAADKNLIVLQTGATLRRICADTQPDAKLDQVFDVVRPEGRLAFDWVMQNKANFFLLKHRASQLLLRGEFIWLPEIETLLFLGSPWFTDASEIAAHGLGFEDFAIHDPVVDMLQVYQASKLALADAKKLADKLTVQRAELRKQTAEARTLALIAARTDNAAVLTDTDGKIVWINEGFTRITGYTFAEVAGKKPGSFLQGPDTDPATVRRISERLSKGEGFSEEILNYGKHGRRYWLAIEVQPIHDDAGQLTHFMAVESDITARREAEEALKKTNALQRAMIESAGYAIISTDPQGLIRLFNPAAERMLGYTAAEMIGRQSPAVFHVAEEAAARAQELTVELGREVKPGFESFVAKAEMGLPDQREWTYVRKDGGRFPVLLSVAALFDDSGKITGYLGVASDLTERKRDEEKIRATLSELERFNRVMMNREERVIELKREVNRLLAASGQPPAYPSANEISANPTPTN